MRAVVTPRACAAPDGEPLPLHEHVRRLLDRGATGIVNVFGDRGSGKTTALRHLADLLQPDASPDGPLVLLDEDAATAAPAAALNRLVVLTTRPRALLPHLAAFRMAPWTNDDAIEYLLATRPDRCASVMDRLKQSPAGATTQGLPRLWVIVLEEMIASGAIATPAEALRHHLAARLTDETVRHHASAYCLRQFMRPGPGPGESRHGPLAYLGREDPGLARLICHPPVQLLLAAQRIVWDLGAGTGRSHLHRRLPGELLREVAALAGFREPVMDELRWLVEQEDARRAHATAASILHATGGGWRPDGCKPDLCGARLEGAKWAGVDLAGADLSAAHLAGAELDAAKLDDATIASADLSGASLRRALLRSVRAMNSVLAGADLSASIAPSADFAGADLRGADLSDAHLRGAHFAACDLTAANFRGADLRGASFVAAHLDGTDLTGADLTAACARQVSFRRAILMGVQLRQAELHNCDFRGIFFADAALRDARFHECDLAGTYLIRADLRGASLHASGLARVRWENVDLRGADLTGASFHTGSSRCGLVGSTIASEGTRTGFYTDDYDDRSYKSPEEIRKASLCGADLRGAKVDETDFYLVDLRGARYSPAQADHFRRCGAIL